MQGTTEASEFLDAPVDVVDPPCQQVANLSARWRMASTLLARDQLLDVIERQAKRLRLLDESDLVHHVVRVAPESALRSWWDLQESPLLVVSERLDGDAGVSAQSRRCDNFVLAPSVFLPGKQRPLDTLHCGDHVPQTTGASRISKIARASLRSDVFANAIDHRGTSVLDQLGANDGFGFPEAVAEETCTFGLLVPDRHTEITRVEVIAGVAEVHDVAGRITAESIMRQLNASKRDLRQQRLDGLELNGRTALAACGARTGAGLDGREIAAVIHRSRVSTLKCTSESSVNRNVLKRVFHRLPAVSVSANLLGWDRLPANGTSSRVSALAADCG